MIKKVWIAAGDIILVGLRDYKDDKVDVILKYMPDEARLLKAYWELPGKFKLNDPVSGGTYGGGGGGGEELDDNIDFQDEDCGMRISLQIK